MVALEFWCVCVYSFPLIPALVRRAKRMKPKLQRAPRNAAAGPRGKAAVLAGRKEQTSQGLKKDDLMKNTKGKTVSKAASAAGKKKVQHIQDWRRWLFLLMESVEDMRR